MSEEDDRLAWMVLARGPRLRADIVSSALELLGGPGALVRGSAAAHQRVGLPERARAFLATAPYPSRAERRWLEGTGHHLIPFTDSRYPPTLRGLLERPIALYLSGCIEALSNPQLAVVGSRNPTPQGRQNAFDLSERLAQRGLGIISGLAEGIDTCAHRGALQARGITIGVLGTGIDGVYPRCNAPLCREIEIQGALLSEFPLGTPPRRANFPQRNRIIATMALGTVVVEAARRSGSLITARLANSHGREVFAVPGSIHNPYAQGCHDLIKAGAKLVESADDILCELNFSAFFSNDFPASSGCATRPLPAAGMDKDHKILLDALGFDPVDLDTLVVRTGFKPEVVSSMVLILELEGHVQTAPGGRYSRVANRRAGGER